MEKDRGHQHTLGCRQYGNESNDGWGYVRIKWIKQRALEKLLEAGISRVPRSARKAAGAAGRLKGFPGRSAGPGPRGPGEGLLAAAGPRGSAARGAGAARPESAGCSVHSCHARQLCGLQEEGSGESVPPPENAGLRQPRAWAAVRVLPLPQGWVFFGCAAVRAPPT